MTNNPYRAVFIDESSGIEIPNSEYYIWAKGYQAGREDEREVMKAYQVVNRIRKEEK